MSQPQPTPQQQPQQQQKDFPITAEHIIFTAACLCYTKAAMQGQQALLDLNPAFVTIRSAHNFDVTSEDAEDAIQLMADAEDIEAQAEAARLELEAEAKNNPNP